MNGKVYKIFQVFYYEHSTYRRVPPLYAIYSSMKKSVKTPRLFEHCFLRRYWTLQLFYVEFRENPGEEEQLSKVHSKGSFVGNFSDIHL